MLGKTFTQHHQQDDGNQSKKQCSSAASSAPASASVSRQARQAFAVEYDELKDRAWMSILRSTTVLSKLSSRAQKRIESEFDQMQAKAAREDRNLGKRFKSAVKIAIAKG